MGIPLEAQMGAWAFGALVRRSEDVVVRCPATSGDWRELGHASISHRPSKQNHH